MKNAWGYDSGQPGYRTHYCTSLDDKNMLDMVDKGFFEGPKHVGNMKEGYAMFYLTEKGINELKVIKKQEDELKARLRHKGDHICQ